jgi:hypothetical protein
MTQAKPQSKAIPRFERPSEAVVYWALENLCEGAGGRYMMPLPKLAQRCGLAVSTTNRAVLSLTKQGLIQYHRGYNQSRPSIFEIPLSQSHRGEKVSSKRTARPKIGILNPNDSDSINNISIGDNDIADAVHKQNEESESTKGERLACQVADGLDDMKNLRLYQSYCRRYPADIILKAFARAREPSPDKIKKSRGALFNFLVQLYGGKQKHNPGSGPSAG